MEFTFDDFGMDKPRVAIVLSVADTIRLEFNLHRHGYVAVISTISRCTGDDA